MSIIHSVTSTIQWMSGNKSYSVCASVHEPIHEVAYFMAALMACDATRICQVRCTVRNMEGEQSLATVGINHNGALTIEVGPSTIKLTREDADRYFLEPFQVHAPVLYGHGLVLTTAEGKDFAVFYDSGSDSEETWLVDGEGNIIVLVETYDERIVEFDRAMFKGLIDGNAYHEHKDAIEEVIALCKAHITAEEE